MKLFIVAAVSAALVAIALLGAVPAVAAYADRPTKLIVPWAAGGDTDNNYAGCAGAPNPVPPLFTASEVDNLVNWVAAKLS